MCHQDLRVPDAPEGGTGSGWERPEITSSSRVMRCREGIEGIESLDFLVCWEWEFTGDVPGVGVGGCAAGAKAETCGGPGWGGGWRAEPVTLSLLSTQSGSVDNLTPSLRSLVLNRTPIARKG